MIYSRRSKDLDDALESARLSKMKNVQRNLYDTALQMREIHQT